MVHSFCFPPFSLRNTDRMFSERLPAAGENGPFFTFSWVLPAFLAALSAPR